MTSPILCDYCNRAITPPASGVQGLGCTNPNVHIFHPPCVELYKRITGSLCCPECDRNGRNTPADVDTAFQRAALLSDATRIQSLVLVHGRRDARTENEASVQFVLDGNDFLLAATGLSPTAFMTPPLTTPAQREAHQRSIENFVRSRQGQTSSEEPDNNNFSPT